MQENDRKLFWRLQDVQVLALTAYGEARGEEDAGVIAVISTILTRVEHRAWDGRTIKHVCFMPKQFSCYNDGDPNYPLLVSIAADWRTHFITDENLVRCHDLAVGVMGGILPRNVRATQYYAPAGMKKEPYWASGMRFVAQVGGHRFFIDRDIG
jgi:spore germination cell wall hydrolase CwlJ-like protein